MTIDLQQQQHFSSKFQVPGLNSLVNRPFSIYAAYNSHKKSPTSGSNQSVNGRKLSIKEHNELANFQRDKCPHRAHDSSSLSLLLGIIIIFFFLNSVWWPPATARPVLQQTARGAGEAAAFTIESVVYSRGATLQFVPYSRLRCSSLRVLQYLADRRALNTYSQHTHTKFTTHFGK